MNCEDSLLVFGNQNLNRNDRKSATRLEKLKGFDWVQYKLVAHRDCKLDYHGVLMD